MYRFVEDDSFSELRILFVFANPSYTQHEIRTVDFFRTKMVRSLCNPAAYPGDLGFGSKDAREGRLSMISSS